jgi:predicted ester cyclase
MTLEDNKRIARRYFEDAPFNPAACDEIFAPRFLFHTILHAEATPQTVGSDPESEKAAYEQLKATFDGWHFTIQEMIAEDERVLVRWTSSGRQVGELNGLPPTRREITNSGINIFRIVNDRIAEVWDIQDRLWHWQQLGVLPDLQEALAAARKRAQPGADGAAE